MRRKSGDICEEIKNTYLNKLKHYKSKGVKVLIDGDELPEEEWDCIFNCKENNYDQSRMFYMADFVLAEPDGDRIREVRFDKVYIKDFSL